MPKRGSSRPVSVRMATDTLTMASRKTASAIPWETWQRSHLLESAWMVDRFLMIFKVKSIDTVDNAGKQVDGIKRPREPPTGGTKMDIGRILPTEAAAMFYIHARMRKRRSTGEKTDKTDKTGIEKSRFV